MKISLVPRAAPSDRIRIWVGILAPQAPAFVWHLDDHLITDARIHALRPLASAIPVNLLNALPADNFTVVFEIGGLIQAHSIKCPYRKYPGCDSEC